MEIKFRAWDKIEKKMRDIERIVWNKGRIVEICDERGYLVEGKYIKNWELLQFTGLKDISGKEIFAGDIVKHSSRAYTPFENSISVVEWFSDNFCYIFRKKHTKEYEKDKQVYDTERIANAGGGYGIDFYPEIVGNIFENPEMLK